MYMIRFIEDNIIIIAEIGMIVIVCAAALIALYAINQAVLKYRFCKRYRIEKLPKSIVIKHAKMGDVNEYELQYPYWNHQKRDGTADRRYKGNYIVWPKSYLRIDNIILSSRKPTAILNTVRSLRRMGVFVKLSPEEVKKRRILEKKKRVLSFDVDLQQIVNMYNEHPTGFEQMCATLFEKMGYTCHVTPKTNDGGYDIYIQKGGETGIVECKCYSKSHKVGRPEIQKLVGANVIVQAKNLLFVTTSDFTPEARLYAEKSDVTLISGQSLMKMLQEYGDTTTTEYEVINAEDATAEFTEQQTLKFHNDRMKPEIDIYKKDIKTGELVAGAVYNLITTDNIYNADGKLLFHAGDLIATSAPTDENGHTTFVCDLPMRGQYYGVDDVYIPENIYGTGADHTKNSGNYIIREIKAPDGYYLDAPDAEITFTYAGAESATVTIESTFQNDATSFHVSKRELTGDEELPGAKLTIKDTDGNVVREWISGEEPVEIRGLLFDKVYTLTETNPAPGYALAEDIRFKLVQSKNEDGDLINAADVYVCIGKDWLIFDHWEKMEDSMVVMRDDIIRVEISKQDITTKQELPGAHLVLKDENGNVIASWVSSDKPYYIEKLPAGKYVLIEESAPDGYLVAENIEFEVKPTGEIQTVVMYDRRIPTPEQPTPEPPIPPALPQTGDLPWLPVALGIAAAGAAIGILVMSRKRDLALRDDDSKQEQQDHEQ